MSSLGAFRREAILLTGFRPSPTGRWSLEVIPHAMYQRCTWLTISRDSGNLPFDRVLNVNSQSVQTPSILYADITSPLFAQFHQTITSTARNGQTSYRVRYRPSQSQLAKRLAVNGYGIELALKRTDYIVIDDRSAAPEEAEDPGVSAENGAAAGEFLLETEEVADLKPLSSKELLGLGLKTASFIMASDDPFDTLVKVSQDFPKHSSPITKLNASEDFIKEHSMNRNVFLPAGYNVIWMNGMQVQARQMDAFGLLEQLRRERSIVNNLRKIGFSGSEAVQILTHEAIASSKVEGDAQRYDYRDDLEGGKIIIWLNDIEKDKRYSSWPAYTSAVSVNHISKKIEKLIVLCSFCSERTPANYPKSGGIYTMSSYRLI